MPEIVLRVTNVETRNHRQITIKPNLLKILIPFYFSSSIKHCKIPTTKVSNTHIANNIPIFTQVALTVNNNNSPYNIPLTPLLYSLTHNSKYQLYYLLFILSIAKPIELTVAALQYNIASDKCFVSLDHQRTKFSLFFSRKLSW